MRFHSTKAMILISKQFYKTCDCYTIKITSMLSSKISAFHAKFCTISCNKIQDRTTTTIFEKTEKQRPQLIYMYPNCIIVISNDIYIVYKFFPNFGKSKYPKISEKVKLQCHLLSDLHQKMIETNLNLDKTKYKISWNSVH